jgi:hypothetical protein
MGVTGRQRPSTKNGRNTVMYAQQKRVLNILMVAAAALGCSASVLSGALTALSAGTIVA